MVSVLVLIAFNQILKENYIILAYSQDLKVGGEVDIVLCAKAICIHLDLPAYPVIECLKNS